MKKPLMISADVHVHPHQKSERRLSECLKALDWFLGEAEDREAHAVIVGDIFHNRRFIDILTYQRTFEILERYCGKKKGLTATFLLGNHDLWYFDRTDVSSVFPLRSIPGVQVIDHPCVANVGGWKCGFLPYTHEPLADLAVLADDAMDITHCRVLFGHVAVDTAILNTRSGRMADVTVEHDGEMVKVGSEVFKEWDRTFLGHYHASQQLGNNVEYVGSPLQLSFGEADQDKHIIFYDPETDEKEYIKNDFSPKHLILDRIPTPAEARGNYLWVTVPDIMAPEVVDARKLLENDAITLEFFPGARDDQIDIESAADVLDDSEDIFERFVDDTCPEGMDKELLLSIGNEIRNASNSEKQ